MKLFLLCSSLLASIISETTHAAVCKYTFDQSKTKVQWNAYKTNKKVPVKGSFTTFKVENAKTADNLSGLFKDVKFSIDASKIDTTNPARDNTISKNFFQKWSNAGQVQGSIAQFKEESATNGSFDLVLTLNGVTKNVPMNYTIDEKGNFVSKGVMNLLDFNSMDALKSLNKACLALHSPGSTWADVELELISEFRKDC